MACTTWTATSLQGAARERQGPPPLGGAGAVVVRRELGPSCRFAYLWPSNRKSAGSGHADASTRRPAPKRRQSVLPVVRTSVR